MNDGPVRSHRLGRVSSRTPRPALRTAELPPSSSGAAGTGWRRRTGPGKGLVKEGGAERPGASIRASPSSTWIGTRRAKMALGQPCGNPVDQRPRRARGPLPMVLPDRDRRYDPGRRTGRGRVEPGEGRERPIGVCSTRGRSASALARLSRGTTAPEEVAESDR